MSVRRLQFIRVLLVTLAALSEMVLHAATHTVKVEDSYYDPFQLAVNVGDTVVWDGLGGQDHTVTSDDNLFNAPVNFGETFSFTFTEAGSYWYFCENHGTIGGGGMAGVVVVSASTANRPPVTPVNESPGQGATNQPLTLQLQASAFSDPDPQDFHRASEWNIRRASDNAVVFNSGADTVNKTNRTVPGGALAHGSNYTWQVRYQDGRGVWSAFSTATAFTTLVPVTQTGSGLFARYGNSTNATLTVATNAAINFDWGTARPHRRITSDAFHVVWEGSILPQFTEVYHIQLHYRGRSRVWVKGQLIIDEWKNCPFVQTRRGPVNLVGGQLAAIRIEYLADPAGGLAALRWTSPSQAMEIIPTTRLFPSDP